MSESGVVAQRGLGSGLDRDPLEEMQDTDPAEAVQRTLRAGGCKPPFGWDAADHEDLWSPALRGYAGEAIMAAARDWVLGRAPDWPDLPAFLAIVKVHDRELHRSGDPRPPGACPECGDGPGNRTNGQVMVGRPEDPDFAVRPCSECNPEGYDLWFRGHNRNRDVGVRCHCGSEYCSHKPRSKGKR